MAIAYGVNETLKLAGGLRGKGTHNAHVKVLLDSYVFPIDIFAAADFISIGKLPPGARVIGGGIVSGDTGTTGAWSLGPSSDYDGIVAAGDSDGATGLSKKSSSEALLGQVLDADDEVEIFLDCTEATDDAAGITISAWVEYIVD